MKYDKLNSVVLGNVVWIQNRFRCYMTCLNCLEKPLLQLSLLKITFMLNEDILLHTLLPFLFQTAGRCQGALA